MLDDPENKTWIVDTEIVPFGDRGLAIARCRQIAEQNELKGEGRCTLCGVRRLKSGKAHRCVFEREIENA